MAEPTSFPEPSKSSPLMSAVKDILGGTFGGIGLVLVGQPFDTLKVRLQTQSTTNPQFSGMLDCLKKTIATEGMRGLYKGVESPLYGQAIFNAVQFFVNGKAKQLVQNKEARERKEELTITESFAAGAITGLLVAFVEGPIDLFKTQLQTQIFKQSPAFNTFFGALSYTSKNFGIRGWYQGLSATIVRNVPAVSCYFGAYEAVRMALAKRRNVEIKDLHASELLAAGGVGGFSYWIFVYPIDVVKSTMQSYEYPELKKQKVTLMSTAKKLYREAGTKAFFRGLAPCLIRSFPANAVCFYLYEKTTQVLTEMGM